LHANGKFEGFHHSGTLPLSEGWAMTPAPKEPREATELCSSNELTESLPRL
jgi:hypothetical protein